MNRTQAVRLLALIVIALVGLASTVPPAQAQTPRFERVSVDEPFPSPATGDRVERGYLVVLQDRADPESLELRLPVIVIRAQTPTGAAPVLFVSGGPGVGDLSAARFPGAYPFTASRDFIVMGRRGTRHAQPSMACPDIGPLFGPPTAELNAAIDQCRAEAVAAGIDPQHYHSAASAADIDDLRQVLGAEQIALFSLSYGTRLALTYARDFPGRVEAMMLDSPLPHTARYDDRSPASLEAALRRIAQLCAQDQRCDTAYPDLERRYFEAMSAPEPAEAVLVSNAAGLATAPRRMDAAARSGPVARSPASGSGSDFDWGVRLSVWCSEALPYAERASGPDEDSFGGLDGAAILPETCARWAVPVRPEAELAATLSDTPTLILAGEFDALTPPAWGYEAAQTLSQSRVIEIPAGFHTETTNWGGDGCAMSIVARFFEAPDAVINEQTPPDCITARAYPAFALD